MIAAEETTMTQDFHNLLGIIQMGCIPVSDIDRLIPQNTFHGRALAASSSGRSAGEAAKTSFALAAAGASVDRAADVRFRLAMLIALFLF
jgi:hypothetical protein